MNARDTQVVVFAGGMGKRIGTRKPKSLLIVGGKTLLERCVQFFSESGFEEFVFLLGYGAEEVLKHVKKICNNYRYSIDPVLGFGRLNSLNYAVQKGAIDTSKRAFFYYPDDILFGKSLAHSIMEEHLRGVGQGSIASVVLSEGIEFQYGVAYLDKEGNVFKFMEKPFLPLKISVGAYIFEPAVYSMLKDFNSGEIETSIFPFLASKGLLRGIVIPKGSWVPVNTRKDLEKAERMLEATKR